MFLRLCMRHRDGVTTVTGLECMSEVTIRWEEDMVSSPMAPNALNSEGKNCLMVPACLAASTSFVCWASAGPLTAEITCAAR